MNEQTRKLIETIVQSDNSMSEHERRNLMDFVRNQMQMKSDRLVPIKEAAKILSINAKSVWRMARTGRIHIVSISPKARRVRMSELESIMNGSFIPTQSYCPKDREERESNQE